jgi:hypothetical protein
MNTLRSYMLVIMVLIAGLSAKTNPKQDTAKGNTTSKIVEGNIVSVDVDKNSLVLKARIYREDSIHVDKGSVLVVGNKPSTIEDLEANSDVKVRYKMNSGKKSATRISIKSGEGFLPDTTELGENILIAEGSISSIDKNKTFLILKAPMEKEYIFSIDPRAEIKSGLQTVPIKDLKPNYSVNIKYSTNGSKKVAYSIIHNPLTVKIQESNSKP